MIEKPILSDSTEEPFVPEKDFSTLLLMIVNGTREEAQKAEVQLQELLESE